jgi:type VI secretion system protein ImpF
MAQSDLPKGLVPSLKDRLLDPESMGTRALPGYTLAQVVESVRLDLEDLLNTRRSHDILDATRFPELARSIVTYGLPDLSVYGGTTQARLEAIAEVIESTIAQHEPRLRNVKATLIRSSTADLKVRYHIDAELRADPAPRVAFDTEIEITTGYASIHESAG